MVERNGRLTAPFPFIGGEMMKRIIYFVLILAMLFILLMI
jgi:hypothetical protein